MMLRQNESLIDPDFTIAQLTVFECTVTCYSFRVLFDLFGLCSWTAVFLQYPSAEYIYKHSVLFNIQHNTILAVHTVGLYNIFTL